MKYRLAGALALALALSVASAGEAEWPENPASEVATFATALRFQIYADHCSAGMPELKASFDSLMKGLRDRIQGISTRVLASDEYHGMGDILVPVEVLDALKHSFHDAEHNVERLNVASTCPQALRDFGALDDESLRLTFTSNLKAVHTMSKQPEAGRAR